jgi:hypothetical protein
MFLIVIEQGVVCYVIGDPLIWISLLYQTAYITGKECSSAGVLS